MLLFGISEVLFFFFRILQCLAESCKIRLLSTMTQLQYEVKHQAKKFYIIFRKLSPYLSSEYLSYFQDIFHKFLFISHAHKSKCIIKDTWEFIFNPFTSRLFSKTQNYGPSFVKPVCFPAKVIYSDDDSTKDSDAEDLSPEREELPSMYVEAVYSDDDGIENRNSEEASAVGGNIQERETNTNEHEEPLIERDNSMNEGLCSRLYEFNFLRKRIESSPKSEQVRQRSSETETGESFSPSLQQAMGVVSTCDEELASTERRSTALPDTDENTVAKPAEDDDGSFLIQTSGNVRDRDKTILSDDAFSCKSTPPGAKYRESTKSPPKLSMKKRQFSRPFPVSGGSPEIYRTPTQNVSGSASGGRPKIRGTPAPSNTVFVDPPRPSVIRRTSSPSEPFRNTGNFPERNLDNSTQHQSESASSDIPEYLMDYDIKEQQRLLDFYALSKRDAQTQSREQTSGKQNKTSSPEDSDTELPNSSEPFTQPSPDGKLAGSPLSQSRGKQRTEPQSQPRSKSAPPDDDGRPEFKYFPGKAEDDKKVKKDARYQKRFYKGEPILLPKDWGKGRPSPEHEPQVDSESMSHAGHMNETEERIREHSLTISEPMECRQPYFGGQVASRQQFEQHIPVASDHSYAAEGGYDSSSMVGKKLRPSLDFELMTPPSSRENSPARTVERTDQTTGISSPPNANETGAISSGNVDDPDSTDSEDSVIVIFSSFEPNIQQEEKNLSETDLPVSSTSSTVLNDQPQTSTEGASSQEFNVACTTLSSNAETLLSGDLHVPIKRRRLEQPQIGELPQAADKAESSDQSSGDDENP